MTGAVGLVRRGGVRTLGYFSIANTVQKEEGLGRLRERRRPFYCKMSLEYLECK